MATADTQQLADAPALDWATNKTTDTLSTQSAGDDHVEGDSIRRQVEFYFSDDNLPTDRHLLERCGGRKNEPVPIKHIMGFKKMRSYKPRGLVVAALRKSPFLEVSGDGKTIKRKSPLQGKCVLDPDFLDEDNDVAYDPRVREFAIPLVPQPPQKKVEYPHGMSKNMMKPTGFESTYIEPPMTLEETEEDEATYDPDKHFIERIETAIWRFKRTRRMHAKYASVFSRLMRFGGVDEGPRIGQGLSKQQKDNMDATELACAMAIHNIPWDRAREEHWVVDFDGVVSAFLSSWYPTNIGCTPDAIKNACQVPRSFYNYLRYHRVCPEYDEQLGKALEICDIAELQLPKVCAAGLALPGEFNKSASTIFGGAYAGMCTGGQSWAEEIEKDDIEIIEIGMRDEEAMIKFATGVAVMGTDEQYDQVEAKSFQVIQKLSVRLEIFDMQVPTEFSYAAYKAQSALVQHKLGQLAPLGKLLCKTWFEDDCDEWDLPKENYPSGKPQRATVGKVYEFWVEESVMNLCVLGMKIDATILTLNGGLTVLDEVHATMCSFYKFLPNELWVAGKSKPWHWLKKGLAGDDDEDDVDSEQAAEGLFDDEAATATGAS